MTESAPNLDDRLSLYERMLRTVVAIGIRDPQQPDRPRIIGTGFTVLNGEYICTCRHVSEAEDNLRKRAKKGQQGEQLPTVIFGIPTPKGFRWTRPQDGIFLRALSDQFDICVYFVPGQLRPALALHDEPSAMLGTRVIFGGFPMGDGLQEVELRHLVGETIIAGLHEPTRGEGKLSGWLVLQRPCCRRAERKPSRGYQQWPDPGHDRCFSTRQCRVERKTVSRSRGVFSCRASPFHLSVCEAGIAAVASST